MSATVFATVWLAVGVGYMVSGDNTAFLLCLILSNLWIIESRREERK